MAVCTCKTKFIHTTDWHNTNPLDDAELASMRESDETLDLTAARQRSAERDASDEPEFITGRPTGSRTMGSGDAFRARVARGSALRELADAAGEPPSGLLAYSGDIRDLEICPSCKKHYEKDTSQGCSNSFHCCRDCTWKDGAVTKQCPLHWLGLDSDAKARAWDGAMSHLVAQGCDVEALLQDAAKAMKRPKLQPAVGLTEDERRNFAELKSKYKGPEMLAVFEALETLDKKAKGLALGLQNVIEKRNKLQGERDNAISAGHKIYAEWLKQSNINDQLRKEHEDQRNSWWDSYTKMHAFSENLAKILNCSENDIAKAIMLLKEKTNEHAK